MLIGLIREGFVSPGQGSALVSANPMSTASRHARGVESMQFCIFLVVGGGAVGGAVGFLCML